MSAALVVAMTMAVCAAKPAANVFFLLTDDQDVILGGLEPMTQVKAVRTRMQSSMFEDAPSECARGGHVQVA